MRVVEPGAEDDPVDPSAVSGVDGIVTAAAGLGLAVLVADCVPILAGDPSAGVIAAVHAGRLGAAGGVALRALAAMVSAGARVDAVEVLLGPAICGRCYEVPAAMRDEVGGGAARIGGGDALAALPAWTCARAWPGSCAGQASRASRSTRGAPPRTRISSVIAGMGPPAVRPG